MDDLSPTNFLEVDFTSSNRHKRRVILFTVIANFFFEK